MKTAFRSAVLVLLMTAIAFSAEPKVDIRNGIPMDAHVAMYGKHNPERDYLRGYEKEIWKTIHDEKLPQRIFGLVMDAIPAKSKESAESISEELHTIFDRIDWSAVANSKEIAYGQVMEVPQTYHIVVVRLPSEDAAEKIESAAIELGKLIEKRSDNKAVGAREDIEGVVVHSLSVPKIKDFPFSPAIARVGDVIILSSSAKVEHASLKSLLGGGPSKLEDPRLQAALKTLPKADDAVMFYDGRKQFSQLKEIGNFIRQKVAEDKKGNKKNNEKAQRVASIIERAMDAVAILDYQAAVKYTEGNRHFKTELIQLASDAQDKPLYKVFTDGKPFENWEKWVPADAQSFSLHTGANPHALYEMVMQFIEKEFPEAKPKLEKFEALQEKWGVHIDRDILQAFSGECVSVKLPAGGSAIPGGSDKVVALRCEKPEQIRELFHKGFEKLAKTGYGQSQQLKLEPSKDLEGFDELSAGMLMAFGVRPVIGFHDGWMIVATNSSAAQKLLKTLSGDAPTIATTDRFKKFGIEVKGPVSSITYSDMGANTRQIATFIRQAGMMAPAIIVSAGVKDPKKMKLLQDAVGLLPSIANVVEKFTFLDARLTVLQKGDATGSYIKRNVTIVKEPKAEAKP
jgi:hypothetical protein